MGLREMLQLFIREYSHFHFVSQYILHSVIIVFGTWAEEEKQWEGVNFQFIDQQMNNA